MKLAARDIARFLESPPKTVRVVLVYGPDSSLVSATLEKLAVKFAADPNDPFSVSSLTGAQIAAQPSLLFDEASSLSLIGGTRLVRVRQAVEAVAQPLSSFLQEPPQNDSVVLIEGGDLDKRSKLRALCEGAESVVAAIPCYFEDAQARMRQLAQGLKEAGFSARQDVVAFLESCLPAGHLALQRELEKLILYAQGQKEISLEDVRAVIAYTADAALDDLAMMTASGQKARAMRLLDSLLEQQTAPVSILRALQRHFLRLQQARAFVDGGLDAGMALKKLAPPVFWKHTTPMTRQLERWTMEKLTTALAVLYKAEADVKKTGAPDVSLCAHVVLMLVARG
ncbi:MAG: DNA polymerase III subunit delta [Alphaproteobacteria bacterium]|nr:DNA polymerase III subunit delta [Alphaproteobacteria bacterium]